MELHVDAARESVNKLIENIEKIIVGKNEVIKLAVITLLSQGHLLIADPPGVGKTMLARSLAKSINCTFNRIQFTPDMLPGDVTGVSVFNQKTYDFEFRPGPVMANIVLADEINRANPRVQSALLECMGERQVTVDGVTHPVPAPFHVIATENPVEYESTFSLPETQMDRFLMSISMGYPSIEEEMDILTRQQYNHPIEELEPVMDSAEISSVQKAVTTIHVDDTVKEYIVTIAAATRTSQALSLGASPRGSLALFRASQARAFLNQRTFVLPDDVKAMVLPVLAHRIKPVSSNTSGNAAAQTILAEIVDGIPVPGIPHSS
ncbi:MAG: MoxR family ATPase [Dehalococcoidales bacterium]|nr:MoxR family ATPase [Dehalococcoidales bacterium]